MDSFFDWGNFGKNELYYYEAVVMPGEDYQIFFTVSDTQVLYAYFELLNFTDDLDLYLYRDDGSSELLGEPIAESSDYEATEESFFKGLNSGSYILQIQHYQEPLTWSTDSSSIAFRVEFDSKYFYENSILPNDTLFANQHLA